MKLLIVMPGHSGGGAEFVGLRWASALSERHDVAVLLTHSDPPEARGERYAVRRVGRKKGSLHLVRAIAGELRREKPDALISLLPYTNLLSVLATRLAGSNAGVVISEHNLHSGLRLHLGLSFRVQSLMTRILYRKTDALITVSHAIAAELAQSRHIPIDRVWVIPNPAADLVEPAPRETETDGAALRIVVPARLVPQKRPHLAVEVAAELRRRGLHGVTVDFFGSGPLEETIRALGKRLGVMTVFHGWVDAWYNHTLPGSVVLLPSSVEGFGNVLVEAAARSVPSVVSSRALGAADACIPGVTAQLVAADDVASYADGVEAASRMIVPDVSGWLQRFTTAESVKDLEKLLLHVQERRKRE